MHEHTHESSGFEFNNTFSVNRLTYVVVVKIEINEKVNNVTC